MRISVRSTADAERVPHGTKEVHLVRPLPAPVLEALAAKAEKLHASQSTLDRISRKVRERLTGSLSIELSRAIAGRPLAVEPSVMGEIFDLKREGLSIRQIAKELEVSKSTVHYLLKYADRNKIKVDGVTMHLASAQVQEQGDVTV